MFFESLPTEEGDLGISPELPPWLCPALPEMGAVLAVERLIARSDHAALTLPTIRAYRTGCTFHVEIALRQGGLSLTDYWDLHMAILPSAPIRLRAGERLPPRLLRWGVRYADGTKVTSIDRRRRAAAGPLLQAMRLGDGLTALNVVLWLWPLPPPETFELAVEWPLSGIEFTAVELDGAAIVAGAARSVDYWS
ncbi:hypothetical protein [Nonomuraea zeae]|uniref:Uncharacterized protein n=1 Tax=Nonomuraea zeae TaxID=1642303 RepID=A0A5S4H2C5_9ACTN|nr:hypothetical protein [Nonomuraea zeae]TMR39398.1 hypothetical protein ETD85_01760 [Nonomuraea zeae]